MLIMVVANFGNGIINMLSNYSNIYAISHRATRQLLEVDVIVEEKIDGSQFSFGIINGELQMRSKNCEVSYGNANGMFGLAVQAINDRQQWLKPNYTYRAEFLQKPKHNVLAYPRVPKGNLIIFDIETPEGFLPPAEKQLEAQRIKLECVPTYYIGKLIHENDSSVLNEFLQRESILGGGPIEGVVIKPLSGDLYGQDKKLLIAKLVRAEFKEAHKVEWKTPTAKADIIEALIAAYRTEARWNKAIQHLRDSGKLLNAPQDIGPLMKEIQTDVSKEEEESIKEALWRWARPQLLKNVANGFPEFYKAKLNETPTNDLPV